MEGCAARGTDQFREVDLAVAREIESDPPTASRASHPAQRRRDAPLGDASLLAGERPAQTAQTPSFIRHLSGALRHADPYEKKGGATHLCRHEPLLSTWSNIRGRLRHLRLPARGGPAQCCRRT